MLIGGTFALHPITATASCAIVTGGDPIVSAPLVFVGTVISTGDGGRRARVRVESIWYGQHLPTYLEVSGSPVSGSAATSVDRTYQAGQRYLFVPEVGTGPIQSPLQGPLQGPLMDNACSATQPFTAALAAQAPASAFPPDPGGSEAVSGPPWRSVGLAVGAVALLGAIGLWVRRRREPAAKPRT